MKSLVTLVLLALAALPARAEDDPKKALESLQGEWKMVEFFKEGNEEKDIAKAKVVIAGSKMTINLRGDKAEELTFAIDLKQKPATIDLTPPKKGGAEVVVKGIYKLEMDKLTICFGLDAKDRPTEFKSQKGTLVGMFVLERVKK